MEKGKMGINKVARARVGRKISNRAGFKKVIGNFPSIKMNKMVCWESQLERDFIVLLEFDNDVVEYREQPLEIAFTCEGKPHKYYPDFYVRRRSSEELIEVKPAANVEHPENKLKFLAGAEYCRKRGWIFKVVTDEQIRKGSIVDNLKLLGRYALLDVPSDFRADGMGLIAKNGEKMPLQTFTGKLKEKYGVAAIKYAYSMLYHQELSADLETPISGQTLVWISKGAAR